jgi:molybdopterin converting factor small subunit
VETVTIRLDALLRDAAEKRLKMPLEEGATVRQALAYARGRHPELTLEESDVIVTVNEELVQPDRRLAAGDVLMVIPPIEGG